MWDQIQLDCAVQHHFFQQLVLADVSADVCWICPAASSRPLPTPSTPTLLLMVVRFFVPLRTSARMRFSGMPHSPKPPTMIDGTVEDVVDGFVGVGDDFVHGQLDSKSNSRRVESYWLLRAIDSFSRWARSNSVRQLARAQVFADVRQSLLQLEERILIFFYW